MPNQYKIPATPRVISPSPTPSDLSESREHISDKGPLASPPPIPEEDPVPDDASGSDSSVNKRSRTRSRSPMVLSSSVQRRRKSNSGPGEKAALAANGHTSANGHLSPYSSVQENWRVISRSPSPLGLIPLHSHYRTFIHRHEIPRKLLHVSIGFVALDFFRRGVQANQLTPWLFSAFIPISATDFLRHRFPTVNRFYIRCLGALMRETEVSGFNGVIWYILGVVIVLHFLPKDVAMVSVLLLSWCDTAASTFGRLYGRYTPRLRRGKSLAGTLAAWVVGVMTAVAFWGYIVPAVGSFPNDPEDANMFSGSIRLLPSAATKLLEWVGISTPTSDGSVVSGPLALGIVSLWTGVVGAGSELIDLFGFDDNLTIPLLSGIGLWGFFKVFGA
ncbi:phosphatidate cytidylyltransferase [Trichophyton tonsurans CBS 112818]|uniref:Phosphatidate cytidylyltransferase n=2 Tax=Trichophyton TaxID=5550 RepID=F2PXA0_TRIEC|nr:phosphatidate cytidylyltransferase [Trichophyton tonsurans CBS 112818]EGE06518.1 phosphatidate cytidylyltransferase [Trichophyton equinum CBS 127.97]